MTNSLKASVRQAIADIVSVTHWRFHPRAGDGDYIRFKRWNKDYSESDEIGRDGGRQDIKLMPNASVRNVTHEICHALGLHHEHQRRDRDAFVKIVQANIRSGHHDQFSKKSSSKTKHHGPYDRSSIMHYTCTAYGQYEWGPGWSDPAFYQANKRTFLLLMNGLAGGIDVSELEWRCGSWRPKAEIQAKSVPQLRYGGLIRPFVVTNGAGVARMFLFAMNNEGWARIYKLDEDGVGSIVVTYDWRSGWTSAAFYTIGGTTYLFLLKKGDGAVHIHRMQTDGKVGARRATYDWSSGWTQVKPFWVPQADGTVRHFLFLLKVDGGAVHIHRLKDDGTVGTRVDTRDWSDGWTSAEFYMSTTATHLILMKRSNGNIHLHAMRSNGKVGVRKQTVNWTSGYGSLGIFQPATGTKYMLIVKGSNGIAHLHPLYTSGTIGPDTDAITIKNLGTGDLGGSSLSAGDIDALNEIAPLLITPVARISTP